MDRCFSSSLITNTVWIVLLASVAAVIDELKVVIEVDVADCELQAQEGDTLLLSYNGTFENGESFNATTPGIPVNLTLGTLIQGLNSGLSGACIGQTRKIFIPHQLGYNDDAEAGTNGNAIPPNTDVIFLVKVINIFPFETEVITNVYENTTDFALIDGSDNSLENGRSNEGDNNDSKRPLRNHPHAVPHHSRPFWWYLQFLAIPVLIILLVVDAYYLYKIYFPHGRVKFYKVRDHEPNDIVSTL